MADLNQEACKHVRRQSLVDTVIARLPTTMVILVATVSVLMWAMYMAASGVDDKSGDKVQPAVSLPNGGGQLRFSNILPEPALLGTMDQFLQLGGAESSTTSRIGRRRLVFVGDIHGCIDELMALLERVDYDSTRDHIITTGDMVNKGPNSAAVLEFLRLQKASCVRGNHDDKILGILRHHELASINTDTTSTDTGSTDEFAVALSLSAEQIVYLQSCPVILHAGEFKGSNLVVVHAGLVPSIPLDRQTASHVMNMRIIDVTTLQPSPKHEAPGSLHWYQLWNRYQAMSADERRTFTNLHHEIDLTTTVVIYGHDARKGLQLHEYTRGLDTMCVKGGKLTALVFDEDQNEQLIQVNCKEY